MKWVLRGFTCLVLLLALAAGGGWLWLRTALPQTQGSIELPGLAAAVAVTRDRFGIPRIEAANDADAYFALGFVHAQDRMWQMDFHRRLGAGRLAEVTGPPALALDRHMRTLGLYRLAEAQYAALSPEARAAVDAYAAGVNAWLVRHDGAWPVEFLALRYAPEPWKPADSLVWGRMMAVFLSRNWREEALAAALLKRLTPEQVDLLLPPYPAGAPVTLAAAPDPLGFGSASNWWLLDGNRTVSGKPLLANDPHLRLRAPSLWYLARVRTPGRTLSGATVPGVPFHVLGHNGHIAWGFTSAETDVEDLFVERVDPGDSERYLTPKGPRPFGTRTETIRVRGAADEAFVVRTTRHGPVIGDLQPGPDAIVKPGEVLALAAAGLRPDDRSAEALYRLNRARNWMAFHTALRDWHSPHLHIAYADTEGRTGMIAPARIPIRRQGAGRAPAPGWDGRFDWTGFVPFEELPQIENPPSGRLVNANNPVAGDAYPHPLGRNRTAGYRARRIEQRLAEKDRHDAASMAEIQRDAVSLAARDLLPLMLPLAAPASETARRALALLRGWDGAMARDRPEPLIFTAWLRETARTVFADELGALFPHWQGLRPESLRLVLTGRTGWCNDATTREAEDCGAGLSAALEAAVAPLAAAHGDDPARWRWGDVHVARLDHPVLGRVPAIGGLFGMRPAVDGGAFTVNRAQSDTANIRAPFAAIHGAGFRAVYDLAALDASGFIVATGQSGHVLSRHYRDMTARWRDNALLRIGPEAGADAERLTLVPPKPR
ncbi:MAG: penicillin acylase family protein [Alphaproteobacteria bacterium]|nr:penicillin acylase family protein [Alphaproteobacteria bacterium]